MIKENIVAYLISESVSEFKSPVILTENKGIDTVTIDAILQDTEFNRNKRLYGKDVISDGLIRGNVPELMNTGNGWPGEVGHPPNPTVQRQMTIDPDNICHRILNYRWEGDTLKGHVETLNNDKGRNMAGIIRQGMKVAFSLRALGPIKKTPQGTIVQKPLTIICYDWVFIPSHARAYQVAIVNDTNSNNLNESYCIPILESSAIDYIKDKSENYRIISEFLEFENSNISLSPNNKQILLESKSGEKAVVGIESFISNEINSYFSKF